jgi:hypothetical protein
MKRCLLLMFALAALAAGWNARLAAAQKLPAARNDLVRMAGGWWGTPIDKFPAAAGLGKDDYIEQAHPDREGVKVVTVEDSIALKKWTPATLPAFEFDFTPDDGLTEIIGFIPGEQADAVSALTMRYGKATQEISKVPGAVTYVWDFGTTLLSVAPGFFSMTPKDRLPKRAVISR